MSFLCSPSFSVHRDDKGFLYLYLEYKRAGRIRLLQLDDMHPAGVGVEPGGEFEPITLVRVSKFESMKRALRIYDNISVGR
jgi:hypothetical protein